MHVTPPRWWQTAVVYEIYPRSFADANGDGVGDLPGITSRLDYLAWLGVDAIWIAPFYPSPMADFGYDVADYIAVHPLFGSLADFDHLLEAAHDRGPPRDRRLRAEPHLGRASLVRRIAQRASSAKRDWYTWRDPAPDGGPPNNWISMFNGPAWDLDPATGAVLPPYVPAEQPDLNWRNPEVREAMFDVVRFWLDRGVDGFRIDVAPMVMKDPLLRDNPPNPSDEEFLRLGAWSRQLHLHDHAHPDMHELYRSFRRLLDTYGERTGRERMSVGELHHPDFDVWAGYYGEQQDEIHVPFNFHLLNAPWTSDGVRRAIEGVERVLPRGAWASWVLGNHDQPRFATRAGRRAGSRRRCCCC